MERDLHFIGADIAKRTIDLVIHGLKGHLRIENNPNGINQILAWFKANRIPPAQAIVVMEHTGLYSYSFEKFLFEKGIQFFKVSSLDIKLSIGVTRGKSDRIDAARIARYGAENATRLTPATPMSKALESLKLLNSSREIVLFCGKNTVFQANYSFRPFGYFRVMGCHDDRAAIFPT